MIQDTTCTFLLRMLKQLEQGLYQQTADDIHHRLHDAGIYTSEVIAGSKFLQHDTQEQQ